MRFVKSVLVGVVAVVVSTVLLTAGMFIFVWSRASAIVGWIGIPLFPWGFLIGLAIFAAGFVWEFRRVSRRD